MKRLYSKLKLLVLGYPNESEVFKINMKSHTKKYSKHVCEWEFRADPGEEEHGLNLSRRFCKHCGREQHAYYHPFGDIRVSWEDAIHSEDVKLP